MGEEIRGKCWHCGIGLSRLDFGRESVCSACGKPTHCCRNCRHYAPGRANECMEPLVDRVLDKTRANFCELLEPTLSPLPTGDGSDTSSARKAAEDLFKS
jgi:hypothetical protein